MPHPLEGSYQWLHKKGEPSIHKRLEDYDADRAAGYSLYNDFHDLADETVLTEPYISNDNEPTGWTCKICGKKCGSRLGLQAHIRTHTDA